MAREKNKAKRRWQFGLTECLLLVALVAAPLAVFRAAWSFRPGDVAVLLVAIYVPNCMKTTNA